MPHVLKMKDGKLLTPFGIRDLLDAVQDYAGEELRREIESYIDTNVEDIGDYEKEYDRMEQDNERLADHQRSVLCNIRDEVDALDTLLQDTRLNIVMRQLAAWAAIIAVPTAITGWFGQNLPYLGFGQDWGVWASVISIGLVSVVLYWSFKKRGWL